MIIYEVNLFVKHAVAEDFRIWLTDHIEEMVGLPWFESAAAYESDATSDTETAFVAQYVLADEQALQRYFETDAPRMRQDGPSRFGADMRATRRVLKRVAAA